MFYVMNWKWYTGLQLATLASGVFPTKWHEAYTEAKEAGVVA